VVWCLESESVQHAKQRRNRTVDGAGGHDVTQGTKTTEGRFSTGTGDDQALTRRRRFRNRATLAAATVGIAVLASGCELYCTDEFNGVWQCKIL